MPERETWDPLEGGGASGAQEARLAAAEAVASRLEARLGAEISAVKESVARQGTAADRAAGIIQSKFKPEALVGAFKFIDTDGSGAINYSELNSKLSEMKQLQQMAVGAPAPAAARPRKPTDGPRRPPSTRPGLRR